MTKQALEEWSYMLAALVVIGVVLWAAFEVAQHALAAGN